MLVFIVQSNCSVGISTMEERAFVGGRRYSPKYLNHLTFDRIRYQLLAKGFLS